MNEIYLIMNIESRPIDIYIGKIAWRKNVHVKEMTRIYVIEVEFAEF